MKAIIPLAGKGTRLRPLTHVTPKPLVKVAGRPVMSYILDDLKALGVEEMVFIVGYLRDRVREYMDEAYPDVQVHYVVQEVQDGTAGAVKLAEPWADDELLIVFVDTLFEADLSLARSLGPDWAGAIWAKEVEDYQRFGVIVTDEHHAMQRIVEKPSEPISKLANIGLYYIRDHALLFEGIHHVIENVNPGKGGEYYLTDAFQYMVDKGARLFTAPVGGWYDCGKADTLLETNLHLLSTGRGGVDPRATVRGSEIHPHARVEEGAIVEDSVIDSNVTVERGARVVGSRVRDTIVGAGATILRSEVGESLIGESSEIEGFKGSVSLAPHSIVRG
ncbi:MAG: sugar phosphate nucleotidyltransferase [Gemmatimonadota bacterium]